MSDRAETPSPAGLAPLKVVLTGEGSDELLAGYARYRKTVYNLALCSSYHRWTTEGLRGFVIDCALIDLELRFCGLSSFNQTDAFVRMR